MKFIPNNPIEKLIEIQGYYEILEQDGWETLELTINDRHPPLECSMIKVALQIRKLNLYEIYVTNDHYIDSGVSEGSEPGEVTGWDIRWVLATDEGIKSFPWFDEVITKNDNSTGRRLGAIIWK